MEGCSTIHPPQCATSKSAIEEDRVFDRTSLALRVGVAGEKGPLRQGLGSSQDFGPSGNHHLAMADRSSHPAPSERAGPSKIDWNAVLADHASWLRAVVLARVGEPQAVDEVMQEVALAAVENRAPLADASKVGPWLYQLAVRQTLLYRRRQGRRRKLLDRYAACCRAGQEEARDADPLGWLVAGERDALIRQALGRLPRRDAEILLLKYTENWSYWQLAEHLGISHSAVEARLHRARGRLRLELTRLEVVDQTP
jgi:RNA polymerase sigma-70 factor (ECF subfamily)